jgi:hypothetical protein
MHGKNAAFVSALTTLGYQMRALESDLPVERAPWDVHVLAEPASREVA